MTEAQERFAGRVSARGPRSLPFLTLPYERHDPFEGLPRKQVPGTHPYAAIVRRRISRLFYFLEGRADALSEWLNWQGYQASLPLRKWEGYTEVDWDRVSPEEKKRRTTFTWSTPKLSFDKQEDDE